MSGGFPCSAGDQQLLQPRGCKGGQGFSQEDPCLLEEGLSPLTSQAGTSPAPTQDLSLPRSKNRSRRPGLICLTCQGGNSPIMTSGRTEGKSPVTDGTDLNLSNKSQVYSLLCRASFVSKRSICHVTNGPFLGHTSSCCLKRRWIWQTFPGSYWFIMSKR